ncbi:MAG: hypothetical protein ACW96U_12940 [Candidatus Heimdallarchaeaceae archaeon]|jgi:hypothetical protein
MSKKQKMGSYEHFCVLINAQDNWKEQDIQSVRDISLSQRKKYVDFDYHFYHKLTYRDKKPEYSDCLLCNQIYNLFANLKGNREGILYQGHHYLEPDDTKDIVEYTKLIFDKNQVKKVYILYLDSLKEFKREDINNLDYDEFKELIKEERYTLKEFESLLQENEIKERVLHELLREKYY